MNRPPHIEVKPEELRALIERVKAGALLPGDEAIIQAMAETILYLNEAVEDKRASIARLVRMLFGASTEKPRTSSPSLHLLLEKSRAMSLKRTLTPLLRLQAEKNGHGRNGASAYVGRREAPQ